MKNLLHSIIFLIFVSTGAQLIAQDDTNVKESEEYVNDHKKNGKLHLILALDARNSFVKGHQVKFSGLKIGLGNKKHKMGFGFYNTREPVVYRDINKNGEPVEITINYNYNSLFYEYVFFRSKRWEFSAPIHLNRGTIIGYSRNLSDETITTAIRVERANSLTLSIKGHYKVLRWIGLGSGVGYNLVTKGDPEVREGLSAPFYSFGLKIFMGEVWKLTTSRKYRKSDWVE